MTEASKGLARGIVASKELDRIDSGVFRDRACDSSAQRATEKPKAAHRVVDVTALRFRRDVDKSKTALFLSL